MGSHRVILRAMVLAAALVVPGRAAAAPVEVADGALRVEVAAGIEDAERLPGWIAERNPGLRQRLSEGPGPEPWIQVEIEGQYLDFRYRVVAMREGQPVGEADAWVACPCSNDELLARLDEPIAAAVERLRKTVAAGGHEDPPPVGEPPVSPAPSDVEYRRLTALGTAGIVTGAIGLTGAVVGGTFLGLGERVPADRQHLERDYRPPGVGLLVSGGVLLVTGVALLVVDLAQCKRKHERCVLGGGGRVGVVGSGVVVRFGGRGRST
jgi:hypothetical protein